MSHIPVLGEDRLLTREEALSRMKKTGVMQELIELVKKGEARVWILANGELSFQYNPYPMADEHLSNPSCKLLNNTPADLSSSVKHSSTHPKKLVFRIRRCYFDMIVNGEKTVEYRRDTRFWQIRIKNLFPKHSLGDAFFDAECFFRVYGGTHGIAPIEGVFICGKRKHSRFVQIIERIRTPKHFSKQGRNDVDTPTCLAFHLGKQVN